MLCYSTGCYGWWMRRVLLTKSFYRWNRLPEQYLYEAAVEVMEGRYEADLGGGIVKKRVAYPGRGKSGGARILVANRNELAVVFLVGRDKGDPGPDFSEDQIAAAVGVAESLR